MEEAEEIYNRLKLKYNREENEEYQYNEMSKSRRQSLVK